MLQRQANVTIAVQADQLRTKDILLAAATDETARLTEDLNKEQSRREKSEAKVRTLHTHKLSEDSTNHGLTAHGVRGTT
jgi:hypothetical protein